MHVATHTRQTASGKERPEAVAIDITGYLVFLLPVVLRQCLYLILSYLRFQSLHFEDKTNRSNSPHSGWPKPLHIYIYIYMCVCHDNYINMNIHIYIYIYIERERDIYLYL